MDLDVLLRLIQDDEFGLLNVKPKSEVPNVDSRLSSSFQEINDFIRENGREPQANRHEMKEFTLYSRLCHLRENSEKNKSLQRLDEFNVLSARKSISTIDDIFDDDDMDMLKDWSNSIFNIKHIPNESTVPDYVAQRKLVNIT